MAAPDAVDGSTMQPDNWAPQEDQEMGPGGNGQATAGVSLPVDERSAGQEPENPEYPRGSSVSDNETFREKQVKVLRLFLSVFACSLRALSWVWHCNAGLAFLSSSHILDPIFSCCVEGWSTLRFEQFF